MMSSGPGMNVPSMEEIQMQQQQKAAYEEQRNSILDQIMEPPARERLSRLRIVRPDKARASEDALINAAKSGRIKTKLTEEALIQLLEQFSSGEAEAGIGGGGKKKVVIQRRKYGVDDDDDGDDDSDLM